MTEISPHLSLPFITAAQAQKHVTHNEALLRLDRLVQLSVDAVADSPPEAPAPATRVIVSQTPSGSFDGKAGQIASFSNDDWSFELPKDGWRAFIISQNSLLVFSGGTWQPMAQQDTASQFGINASADSYNRLTVKASASLLDHDGAGHQLVINKAGNGDTASLLFQTGYTGQAEIGLAGDENFHLKTSADGAQFHTGLIARAGSGAIEFPNGTHPDLTLPAISDAGGPDYHYGMPSQMAICDGRSTLNFAQNRIYFSAFYIDRPTEISGGFCALSIAGSAAAGGVIRAGIFQLGGPSGNNWTIGERLADMGSQSSETDGEKIFSLSSPLTLSKGWYATAIGTNSQGVQVKYARVLHPGQQQFVPSGTELRFSGPNLYMHSTDTSGQIDSGFTATGLSGIASCVLISNGCSYMFIIPKWRYV